MASMPVALPLMLAGCCAFNPPYTLTAPVKLPGVELVIAAVPQLTLGAPCAWEPPNPSPSPKKPYWSPSLPRVWAHRSLPFNWMEADPQPTVTALSTVLGQYAGSPFALVAAAVATRVFVVSAVAPSKAWIA